jgi:putative ABC transport system substrate-binding protein
MNKSTIIAVTSIMLNVALIFITLYALFEYGSTTINHSQTTLIKSGTPFKIAIFEPIPHPAIEDITRGFKEFLEEHGTRPYTFNTYNANGNKTLQRSQAEEIAQQNYDLVFTIGASCTQLMKELTSKKNIHTPVVFSAVDDPVGMGIVASLTSSKNNMTGVIETADYPQQLAVLAALKPTTRTMLLVYDPTHGTGLDKDKQQLEELAATYGISLKAVAV